jgi:hypothetical protein
METPDKQQLEQVRSEIRWLAAAAREHLPMQRSAINIQKR